MNLLINIMTLDDLEKIKNILNTDFDDFWNYEILKEELISQNTVYLVAKMEDEIVGFSGIKIIVDEADLMNIVVKKEHRKKGVASSLLNKLIFIAKEKNLKSINLEVNAKNLFAINLYKKFDFVEIGKRKKYYQNDDAILMKLDIKESEN